MHHESMPASAYTEPSHRRDLVTVGAYRAAVFEDRGKYAVVIERELAGEWDFFSGPYPAPNRESADEMAQDLAVLFREHLRFRASL